MTEPQEEQITDARGLTVRAVITRKDGTVEDLGIISKGKNAEFKASSDPA